METFTTDHKEIKDWVVSHHGQPEVVPSVSERDREYLHINFPGKEDEEFLPTKAEKITWETFFYKFEELGLVFVYEDTTKNKDPSKDFHFIQRDLVFQNR